jgi:hypothetical protein
VLAKRDSLLRVSSLQPDEAQTLRSLPLDDSSVFGPHAPAFMSGKAQRSRDAAFLKASAASQPQEAPKADFKRKADFQAPSAPAKKPKASKPPKFKKDKPQAPSGGKSKGKHPQ